MSRAYADSSCFLAMALGEKGSADVERRMRGLYISSSNLLEAEVRSALSREGVPLREELLDLVTWVMPPRPLGREIGRVLEAGSLRGADLWHVACALYLAPEPHGLLFLTLDARQREVAERLGFAT